MPGTSRALQQSILNQFRGRNDRDSRSTSQRVATDRLEQSYVRGVEKSLGYSTRSLLHSNNSARQRQHRKFIYKSQLPKRTKLNIERRYIKERARLSSASSTSSDDSGRESPIYGIEETKHAWKSEDSKNLQIECMVTEALLPNSLEFEDVSRWNSIGEKYQTRMRARLDHNGNVQLYDADCFTDDDYSKSVPCSISPYMTSDTYNSEYDETGKVSFYTSSIPYFKYLRKRLHVYYPEYELPTETLASSKKRFEAAVKYVTVFTFAFMFTAILAHGIKVGFYNNASIKRSSVALPLQSPPHNKSPAKY